MVVSQKLNFEKISKEKSLIRSKDFYDTIAKRRTVREFSDEKAPIEIIKNAVKSALAAPSGANKQPWHFCIVKNKKLKAEIRKAAEKEEKLFYNKRAPDSWLEDLNKFGTSFNKPFLEVAPYLIAVFKERYEIAHQNNKKNYYVNESVGIAIGFLISALHSSGLVSLVHTPSPMGFLENILGRPKNEKAVVLIPTGYPAKDTTVPILKKKPFSEAASIV
ncbi:MAG: nitroreductase family protein [Candidatus Marinimicrobia bacterium]|nr:nitroreductase family protein [Candidatus Neomarinimicrobiota bacterium]|tara:strand:+ start:2266 stop:2922 length:657 start_codon:yes stop_codon:yes gene_type:complete